MPPSLKVLDRSK
ncbi:hypothetical protein BsWGS_21913 [Bradybaena similaris]